MTVAGTFFILKSVEVMSEGTNTQYKVFFFLVSLNQQSVLPYESCLSETCVS